MRTRPMLTCGLAALALIVAGCGDDKTETADFSVDVPAAETTTTETETATEAAAAPADEQDAKGKPKVVIPSGPPPKQLETRDIKTGTGATAKKGDKVSMNYVGVSYSNKQEFDASYDRGEPFGFTLGQGEVIAGWDEGIVGMKVGGRRELIIPPDKGYGAQGQGSIKPNETLVFVVDLVDIK